ncbi:MAG TPA: glycosyltransferase family 4 protein [Terriglobales bacterium]|jgi:glycosyltransferase involved in cell wall biosynthesis|nr:glycosyltransferase family 4 protein [Terriglobales bacterium]
MKLAVLTEIISPYRIPVFNALAKQKDIELHVIFLADTDPTQREWLVYKNEIQFSYRVLPFWRRRYRERNILLNRGLTAALEEMAPDVILCGGYNYIASWQAMAWARKRHIPFLAWVESTAKDKRGGHRPVEFLKRKFIAGCNAFVVPGKSSTEYVRDFNVPPENIFVAPNAVDIEFFSRNAEHVRREAASHRLKLQLPQRFFLYVGRLVEEKGIFDLLAAYGNLAQELRKEIGMVFVGNGRAKAALMAQGAKLGCGSVKFAGFVQKEELPCYYALAEACILPTYTDTWGLVVNEAMACGLPVIVSNAAGCAQDLVEENWNGLLINSQRPDELTAALEMIANNPKMRSAMGQRSRERISQYSPQSCAGGIAEAALSFGAVCHA